MRARVSEKVSEAVSILTESPRSTESVPDAMVITVSRATLPSDVRLSTTRTALTATTGATALSNCGASENRPRTIWGPVFSKQLRRISASARGARTRSVARRSL
jgi:hypothetical protein